ncbi:MAG TPA: hypothetical protein VK427_18310, partial [Kofleriaceae bacterium]|nr:hypothetical protein [Kofleriaceae bacterium]
CTATSAVLGSPGAITVHSDFVNAPPGIWFSASLANKIAGADLDPMQPEISARFNSALNGNPACLAGGTWYYGFDHAQTDLLPVLMHELGHGLGFQSFVSRWGPTIGQLFLGQPDHFLMFMFDNQKDKFWKDMTDAERAASIKRTARRVERAEPARRRAELPLAGHAAHAGDVASRDRGRLPGRRGRVRAAAHGRVARR